MQVPGAKTHVSSATKQSKEPVNYHCTFTSNVPPAAAVGSYAGVPLSKEILGIEVQAAPSSTLPPPPPRLNRNLTSRKRSSSAQSLSKPIAASRSTTFLACKSTSSPRLPVFETPPPSYAETATTTSMNSDTGDDDDVIYTARFDSSARTPRGSSQSLRSRIFGMASTHAQPARTRDKLISTTPGVLCAGETETETDEPSRHLPTARIVPSSGPIVPPTSFERGLTPLLFEFARFLSIIPAVFGTLYNAYHVLYPPGADGAPRPPPQRVDFFVSALWSILTGYQCLALATGLLGRWRLYYPPLATLVRLLALQGICWPATHLTLTVLGHAARPVITWAAIGTTTCMSRSVQLWVTSNLWWERDAGAGAGAGSAPGPAVGERRRGWRRWGGGGAWGGRRWDWGEVGVQCALPAGIVYVVTAWAEQLRREWELAACTREC